MKQASLTQLRQIAQKAFKLIESQAVFIFIVVSLCLFGYLVLQIRTFASREPSETVLNEKMGEQKSIKIDESAVEKVQKLQATNIEVKTLFNQSRDNPFQE